jgi:hypothetical protein
MEAKLKTTNSASVGTVLLAATLWAATVSAAEVYRWVDENGEVHYSESLPPDYKDSGHDVLNRQGMVVGENQTLTPPPPKEGPREEVPQELPRDASGLPRPKALYSEVEMQKRMDNFLMLRYESEQEILDAMNVEIKQLNYDRRLLEGSRASMNQAFRGQVRVAAEHQRAGVPVGDKTAVEITKIRKNLAKNAESLQGLLERENNIRADFEKQLVRYRYLIETWDEESSDS